MSPEWYYIVPICAISVTYCVVKSIAQLQQSRCLRLSTTCCTVERSIDDRDTEIVDVTHPVAMRDAADILSDICDEFDEDDESSSTGSDVDSTVSGGRVRRMTALFEKV